MGLHWKHSSSFFSFFFPLFLSLLGIMVCCLVCILLVVHSTVRCVPKDRSVKAVQCTVLWMARCQHQLKLLWQIDSGGGGGIVLQLELQWQLYWEINVLLVACLFFFFIAQMSVFLNSLLIWIGVKGILNVQIVEHVLLFAFSSISELLTAGCNHVSCWFFISVMHYFSFFWLLSSLFTQRKQKGSLDQKKKVLRAVAWLWMMCYLFCLGVVHRVFWFTCVWERCSAFLKTL